MQPALLSEITDPEPYLADPDFCAEEKLNGRRMILVKRGNVVRAYSRNGNEYVAPLEVVKRMQLFGNDGVFDGELVGNEYFAFDVLWIGAADFTNAHYLDRAIIIDRISPFKHKHPTIGSSDKRKLFDDVRTAGGEGIVFKRLDGIYQPGQRTYGYKYKFYQTKTVQVLSVDPLKCSFGFSEGRCSFPFNSEWPKVGELWEVRYDEISANGKLMRPQLLMRRDDLEGALT